MKHKDQQARLSVSKQQRVTPDFHNKILQFGLKIWEKTGKNFLFLKQRPTFSSGQSNSASSQCLSRELAVLVVSVFSGGGHLCSGQRPPETFLDVLPNMSDRTRWKRDDISTSSSSLSSSSSSSINKRVDSPKYTSVTLPRPSILTPFPRFVRSSAPEEPVRNFSRRRTGSAPVHHGTSQAPGPRGPASSSGPLRTSGPGLKQQNISLSCWVPSFFSASSSPLAST